ncbi:GGDEF domain-containing protein [Saccharopolyspora cebuensis]|uniref:Diguanylate cyclase n=1 Tax=Saccharopolyspora cebuensis TaxID=418759 RepID=A0ABV4CHH5_9PSEU
MPQDVPLLAGHLPAQDRQVRLLLDAGRLSAADIAFDQLIAAGQDRVAEQWNRSTVLVNRALLAWRLGRVVTALELAADGWTEFDVDHPPGPAGAHTTSMLGWLMEVIGHRGPALDLMVLGVQQARGCGDPDALAHCLCREGTARIFRGLDADPAEHFGRAREVLAESHELASPGQVKRTSLAGLARALAGTGEPAAAERCAERALARAGSAQHWFTTAVADWVLAVVARDRHELRDARTYASRALDGAERIRDTLLMRRFAAELTGICELLEDPVGETAALRRSVAAGAVAVEALQTGLGQALEQRRVAAHAQRMAMAAHEAAVRDPLTGTANRRGFERFGPPLLERAEGDGLGMWLIMLDVDGFKEINDRGGHTSGDVVLQELAGLLRAVARTDDLICRWAGDEFVVLLADDDHRRRAGPVLAERIRDAVHAHDWQLALGRTMEPPTVSIGVAGGPRELKHLFAAADIALYRAKRGGRDRVEIDTSTSQPTIE